MAPTARWYVPLSVFVLVQIFQESLVLAHCSDGTSGENPSNHTVYLQDIIISPRIYISVVVCVLVLIVLTTVGWIGCCCIWFKRDREMRSLTRSLRRDTVHFSNRRPSPVVSGSSNPSCSTIHCRLSPRPTLTPRELQRMGTNTRSLGIPYSKSDLSAIAASGKQVVSSVSHSNPELAVRQCYGKHEQVSILASHPTSWKCQLPSDGSSVQLRETSCWHDSVVHYPQTCTSASSLPSSPAYTLDLGRRTSDGQHNL